MFTQQQLKFLVRVQATDDYHCSGFIDVLKEYHEYPLNTYVTEAQLEQSEFDELMVILGKASLEDVFNL